MTPIDDTMVLLAVATAQTAAACSAAAVENNLPTFTLFFERERLAFACVVATRALTPRGIAAKAELIERCDEGMETVGVALSLAEDAVALVKALAARETRRCAN